MPFSRIVSVSSSTRSVISPPEIAATFTPARAKLAQPVDDALRRALRVDPALVADDLGATLQAPGQHRTHAIVQVSVVAGKGRVAARAHLGGRTRWPRPWSRSTGSRDLPCSALSRAGSMRSPHQAEPAPMRMLVFMLPLPAEYRTQEYSSTSSFLAARAVPRLQFRTQAREEINDHMHALEEAPGGFDLGRLGARRPARTAQPADCRESQAGRCGGARGARLLPEPAARLSGRQRAQPAPSSPGAAADAAQRPART